jgi:hypothetical protein
MVMHRMDIARRAQFAIIAVSGVWIVGALSSLAFADIRIARFLRYSAFEVCDYINYHVCRCGNCWRDLMNVATFVDHPLTNAALITLAPVALLSSAAYLTLKLLRWVCPDELGRRQRNTK